ncbi:hypothetical protein Mal64_01010 [Pseudobythopirellula maris]|uniref:PEP-CTERM protein-sorting domain-containing protein n=1 Tax=Pseudobythopirellula maris TaxID=2527991 RepID=A0A5C5ZQB7_9BACT|nr:hypothetical protein [Pseudobythopirellula maris]TWT89722.1 hypothetical protein Mal64_01010 [Pseudobythopirellula maris]
MRTLLFSFALLGLLASQAEASVLSQNLSFNSIEDLIIDQSRSNVYDVTGDGLSVGDVVYGYLNFDEVALDGGGNQDIVGGEITTLFAIEVTAFLGFVGPGGTPVIEHGPSTVPGYTFADLLDPALLAEGVGGNPIDPLTMAIVVSSPTAPDPENLATDLAYFTGADWDMELTAGKATASDFFQITNFGLTVGGSAQETASLSILQTGPGLPDPSTFQPVGADVQTDADSAFDTFGQIALRDGSVFANTNSDSASWDFANRATIAINAPTPEPVSVFVWASLLGLVAANRRAVSRG